MAEALGRNFWLYRIARFVSSLGDGIGFVAFSLWILDLTGSPVTMASIVAPAMFARLFFLPLLGPFGDRFNRKKVIILGDLIQFISWTGLFILSCVGTPSVLLVTLVYIINSFGSAIFASGDSGILPQLVPNSNLLPIAVRRRSSVNSISTIVNGAIAGGVVALIGFKLSLAFNAVSFLMATSLLLPLSLTASPERSVSMRGGISRWGQDIIDGIRFIFSVRAIAGVVVLSVVINFAANPLNTLMPVLVKQSFSGQALVLGMSQSLLAMGALFGSFVIGYVGRWGSGLMTFLVGMAVFGLGTVLLAMSSTFPVSIYISAFIIGLGESFAQIPLSTQIACTIPASVRSRFGASLGFLAGLSTPVGVWFFGALTERMKISPTLLIIGMWILLFTPIAFAMRHFSNWMRLSPNDCKNYIPIHVLERFN